jgi:hypothetical protein
LLSRRRWVIPTGIGFLCLLLFLVPFFWEFPVVVLLKSRMLTGYQKMALTRLYRPGTTESIRKDVHLYNGGYRPEHFVPGPVHVPGKGMNYQDSLGLLLSKSYFDKAYPFQRKRALVRVNSCYGLLDMKGRWVLHPAFDTLYPFRNVYIVKQGKEWGIANRRGRMKTPLSSSRVTADYYGTELPFLRVVQPNGRFHLVDEKGNIRESGLYDSLDLRDRYIFVCRGGKWGVADERGKELIVPQYDGIEVAEGPFFAVRNGGLEGLHRLGDKEAIVPVQYEKAAICTPTTFRVLLNDHYGLLDKNAAVLIEPVYDTLYFHRKPEWIVTGRLGFYALRNTKKLEYPTQFYNWIGPCREGMTVVRNENGYGVLSNKGEVVVTPQYQLIHNYSSQVAVVFDKEQYAVIDRNGLFTLPFSLNLVELYDFQDGVALAARYNLMTSRIQKQYGFVDKKGNTVIPFLYEDGHPAFSNGLAAMKLGGKWGFIDKKGDVKISFIYDTVTQFSNGQAFALYEGYLLTLNTQGATIK